MQAQELQIKIGKKLKELRVVNGWTQEEASKQLHICRNTYSDIELGKTDIALSRLIQFANFYDVDVDYFVSENGKVVFYLTGNQNTQAKIDKIEKQCNEYHGSVAEEKMQNKLEEMQGKLDGAKEAEIENLKIQIAQLQKINALLEKNQ
jgi:transcriptional regulator with XRE-family HTH domain